MNMTSRENNILEANDSKKRTTNEKCALMPHKLRLELYVSLRKKKEGRSLNERGKIEDEC